MHSTLITIISGWTRTSKSEICESRWSRKLADFVCWQRPYDQSGSHKLVSYDTVVNGTPGRGDFVYRFQENNVAPNERWSCEPAISRVRSSFPLNLDNSRNIVDTIKLSEEWFRIGNVAIWTDSSCESPCFVLIQARSDWGYPTLKLFATEPLALQSPKKISCPLIESDSIFAP